MFWIEYILSPYRKFLHEMFSCGWDFPLIVSKRKFFSSFSRLWMIEQEINFWIRAKRLRVVRDVSGEHCLFFLKNKECVLGFMLMLEVRGPLICVDREMAASPQRRFRIFLFSFISFSFFLSWIFFSEASFLLELQPSSSEGSVLLETLGRAWMSVMSLARWE